MSREDLTNSEIIVTQAEKNTATSSKVVVALAAAIGDRYVFETWYGEVMLTKFWGKYYSF
ncbi:hypothetical protein SAMN05216302_101143 [Nitrosomonas aestuarii]|uniref:Uncharacterized protein n=1 Tax=Nitrosomonas aestuarii TaxID=52441 RepID=A0A1I4B7A1_9PROT|nr:hypothetical protein [Nitrosomonas aestuarii]SFK64017.1 hypothetical protein SAMN05216302_101143 [Nitrosomonas aestuarii]